MRTSFYLVSSATLFFSTILSPAVSDASSGKDYRNSYYAYGEEDNQYDQNKNNNQGNENQEAFQSDLELLNKLLNALENNPWHKSYKNINIRVSNGNITITGTVGSEQDRKDVRSIIQKIRGVRNIDNQLEIKEDENNENKLSDNYDNMQYQAQNSQTYNQHPSSQPQTTASDRQLSQRIREALKGGFLSKGFENVSFEVHDGSVTLRGSVNSDIDRRKIMERIQKIQGIKNINGRIEVINEEQKQNRTLSYDYNNARNNASQNMGTSTQQRSQKQESDSQILDKIKNILKGGLFSKGYENITINVRNGNITLGGTVENESDKQKVIEMVQNLSGVREIDDQIRVQPSK
jgi:osmotically-inducible protein OsmY